jgi:hypothetical protein
MQNGEVVGKACFNVIENDDNLEYDIDKFIFESNDNIVLHFQNFSDNIAERIFCEKRYNIKAESDKLVSKYGLYYILPGKYSSGIIISDNTMENKLMNLRYSLFDMVNTKMMIDGFELYDLVPYTKSQYLNAENDLENEDEDEYD